MHVPTAAGRTGFVVFGLTSPAIDRHEANSRLHHSPSKQQILAERMHSITFANLNGFTSQIKRESSFRSRHRIVRLFTKFRPVLHLLISIQSIRVQTTEQPLAVLKTLLVIRFINLRRLKVGPRGMIGF